MVGRLRSRLTIYSAVSKMLCFWIFNSALLLLNMNFVWLGSREDLRLASPGLDAFFISVGGGLKMVQIGRYERVEGFAVLAPAMMSGLGRTRSALESTRSDLDLVF